jgi:hypothetical protein
VPKEYYYLVFNPYSTPSTILHSECTIPAPCSGYCLKLGSKCCLWISLANKTRATQGCSEFFTANSRERNSFDTFFTVKYKM